jgi:Tol biopolymer transport system component
MEVYVRSFPDPSVKVQVSVGGGVTPAWSADGTRLFYRSGGALVAARLTTTPAVQVVARDPVFSGPTRVQAVSPLTNTADFDISRDGQRMVIPVSQSSTYQLVVVPNWLTEFRQRMAASQR